VRNEDDPISGCAADRDLPLLFAGVNRVRKRQGQWIEEYRRGVLEGNPMLPQIGLGRMPLIDY
jgi:hypothetical protein